VSQLLNGPFKLPETLRELLQILHEHGGMHRGMVSLLDPDKGELLLSAVHGLDPDQRRDIRYLPGEGVVGMILERGERIILARVADEPRFLDRLHLYDLELPFVGVPLRIGQGESAGVLAAQPACCDELLFERARFLEMVANLIARSVQLSWELERERRALTAERDNLRRVVRGKYGFDKIVGHSRLMQRVFE
jgi:Nif-specific regulatory protein